ncbi:unnamed protein product [Laminaria digitata]
MCPLEIAVRNGFVGVVRVLVNEGGIRAVGGEAALPTALFKAIAFRRARILLMLLTVDLRRKRSDWANIQYEGKPLLHYGASVCCPAVVSILLEAGADDAVRDSTGYIARDFIGLAVAEEVEVGRRQNVTRRMLRQGPAYRARSWAWPSIEEEKADAGGRGDGDTAAAAAAAVLSSPPAMKTPPVTGVRTFRPKENSSSKLFVRAISRYCAKK